MVNIGTSEAYVYPQTCFCECSKIPISILNKIYDSSRYPFILKWVLVVFIFQWICVFSKLSKIIVWCYYNIIFYLFGICRICGDAPSLILNFHFCLPYFSWWLSFIIFLIFLNNKEICWLHLLCSNFPALHFIWYPSSLFNLFCSLCLLFFFTFCFLKMEVDVTGLRHFFVVM